MCVEQRKGTCGTVSAPKRCLRRQANVLMLRTGRRPGGRPRRRDATALGPAPGPPPVIPGRNFAVDLTAKPPRRVIGSGVFSAAPGPPSGANRPPGPHKTAAGPRLALQPAGRSVPPNLGQRAHPAAIRAHPTAARTTVQTAQQTLAARQGAGGGMPAWDEPRREAQPAPPRQPPVARKNPAVGGLGPAAQRPQPQSQQQEQPTVQKPPEKDYWAQYQVPAKPAPQQQPAPAPRPAPPVARPGSLVRKPPPAQRAPGIGTSRSADRQIGTHFAAQARAVAAGTAVSKADRLHASNAEMPNARGGAKSAQVESRAAPQAPRPAPDAASRTAQAQTVANATVSKAAERAQAAAVEDYDPWAGERSGPVELPEHLRQAVIEKFGYRGPGKTASADAPAAQRAPQPVQDPSRSAAQAKAAATGAASSSAAAAAVEDEWLTGKFQIAPPDPIRLPRPGVPRARSDTPDAAASGDAPAGRQAPQPQPSGVAAKAMGPASGQAMRREERIHASIAEMRDDGLEERPAKIQKLASPRARPGETARDMPAAQRAPLPAPDAATFAAQARAVAVGAPMSRAEKAHAAVANFADEWRAIAAARAKAGRSPEKEPPARPAQPPRGLAPLPERVDRADRRPMVTTMPQRGNPRPTVTTLPARAGIPHAATLVTTNRPAFSGGAAARQPSGTPLPPPAVVAPQRSKSASPLAPSSTQKVCSSLWYISAALSRAPCTFVASLAAEHSARGETGLFRKRFTGVLKGSVNKAKS